MLFRSRDGQTTLAADLPFSGHKITGYGTASARSDVPSLGQVQDNVGAYAVAGYSADAYTLTVSPAVTAYTAGQVFWARIANTNTTTAPTLNISGVGAKPIKASGNLAVAVGTLQSGSVVGFAYNSSADAFELIAPGAIHTATAFRAADGSLSAPGLAFAAETNITNNVAARV